MGTPLPQEDADAVSRVRQAEAELNAAIQALPGRFNVAINTVDITTIGQRPDREIICVNLSISV